MDSAAHLLATAHELHTRDTTPERPASYKIVGLLLAIGSGFCIGTSFVIKKHGLLQANKKYNEEAGEGYGYLKNAWWWLGMSLMIVGELCNLVAYAFTDAILVTPMGALSVVITAILSTIFLKERLSFVGKIGCFNCIIGSVVIAISAPEQSAVATIQQMKHMVIAPGFLSYAGVVIVASAAIALVLGPKYGKKTMLVYISVCSLIGGLSVVATQGLGAAVVAQASGRYGGQFKQWFLYVLLVFVVITLLTEIIFLNVSLVIATHTSKKTKKYLESFKSFQRRASYPDLLCSVHIINYCYLSRPFQGFQGHANTDPQRHLRFLANLFWCCSAPIIQIRQRRPRYCRVQG